MPSIKQREKPEWRPHAPSKVTTMGRQIEVVTMNRVGSGPPVQKFDKNSYLDLRTGEICEYKHGESRADNLESIRRTLSNIRALVNTNVTDPSKCLWVTLTYRENMTDTKQLYEDYKKFWQRLCYWCKVNGIEKPEYITVQEPQGRGAWHVHGFFIWPTAAPFIDNNSVMEKLWPHGFTKTKALANIDNVGAYFSAYLGDMPVEEFSQLPEQQRKEIGVPVVMEKDLSTEREKRSKRFVKGGRLPLYPSGMNIVRRSRGIKDPVVERMTYAQAEKKVSSGKLTFSRSYELVSDDGSSQRVLKTFSKSYYTMPTA